MTKDEIITEMERKPDPEMLLSWIIDHTTDTDVQDVIYAFYDSTEGN